MEVVRGWHNVHSQHRDCVLTIGNFDGVHRGHQMLIERLLHAKKKYGLPATVMIFEPQPNEFFHPEQYVGRLMRLREKLEALQKTAVDRVLVIPFSANFAGVSAEKFVETFLSEKLGVKHIIIGDDFRFGFRRQGDVEKLTLLGTLAGFTVECMPTLQLEGVRVSSTRVRKALEDGDLDLAERLLGHRFAMSGRVAHGDKIGRTIGFPTANIHLHRQHVPIQGVMAVRVYGIDEKIYNGVANVGNRPTVGGEKVLLEVYLFDFDRDIYGVRVQVEFVKKIRDELKFESVEAMRLKIVEDVEWARAVFARA
ncbi:MAG: bifunctional riboflavin kinase/FAD synthetase [Pseudomonadota bacterium]|nr:bifunctional riboflavin kinase/FAD synthetase [Pseudomonadota bacterium]